MINVNNHEWIILKRNNALSFITEKKLIIPPIFQQDFLANTAIIKCGHISLEAEVEAGKQDDNIIYCSPAIFQELFLPDYSTYSALLCKREKQISIGPIIGVLTDATPSKSAVPLPTLEQFCRELTSYCISNNCICCVYLWSSAKNRNYEGFYLHENKWIRAGLPKPSFLYNRIHSRKIAGSRFFQQFYNEMQQSNLHLLNRSFFSKKDLDDLSAFPNLLPYIPKGGPFDEIIFKEMISEHQAVFAKPINGSQGRGIVKISWDENILHIENGKDISITAKSIEDAWEYLNRIIQEKNYWLQQGLSLISVQDQLTDFRVLTHLQEDERWSVTSVAARMSMPGKFITNLSQGGSRISARSVLASFFGAAQANAVYHLIRELALETSKTVNELHDKTFFELGIDIGVETDGKVKLIEINSKPSKFEETQHFSIRPSAKAIGNYAIYKAKLTMEEVCPCQLHSESSQ